MVPCRVVVGWCSLARLSCVVSDRACRARKPRFKVPIWWSVLAQVPRPHSAPCTAAKHATTALTNFCYPYMWAHGAMEVGKDGKKVAFNKPGFVDAIRRFIQAWKDGYDETGLAWDDSGNNRAFLAGQIAATLNGSSIYFVAKKEQPLMAQEMNHLLIPRGPAGRFYWLGTSTLGILKNSKNISTSSIPSREQCSPATRRRRSIGGPSSSSASIRRIQEIAS